jgi:hypothetical protein
MRGASGIIGSFSFFRLWRFGFVSTWTEVSIEVVVDSRTVEIPFEFSATVIVDLRLRARTTFVAFVVRVFGEGDLEERFGEGGFVGIGGWLFSSESRSVSVESEALDMGTTGDLGSYRLRGMRVKTLFFRNARLMSSV